MVQVVPSVLNSIGILLVFVSTKPIEYFAVTSDSFLTFKLKLPAVPGAINPALTSVSCTIFPVSLIVSNKLNVTFEFSTANSLSFTLIDHFATVAVDSPLTLDVYFAYVPATNTIATIVQTL